MARRILIAPDKFKGSLTSFQVCDAIATGIRQVDENAEIFLFPMADGGDGFAEVMKYYLQTDTVECAAVDPIRRIIHASYQWNATTKTAIIEMAVASGMVLLKPEERNPLKTSTYGTGVLIKDAIGKGAEKIILGLGGSATNDAGIGILAALGFQLRNSKDQSLEACGQSLVQLEKIIPPRPLPDVSIEIACDVQNILYGPQGAAHVYAPQKGADAGDVEFLDQGLRHFAEILKKQTGKDFSAIPGTGAAGGIAAGLMGFFDVALKKGIDLILDASGIKNKIRDADLLITGEGKIDKQTLQGKVVSELSQLAHNNKIPAIGFCGILDADDTMIKQLHLQFVGCLTNSSVTKHDAMLHARDLLINKAGEFFRDYYSSK